MKQEFSRYAAHFCPAFVFLLTVALAGPAGAAEVYKWVDQDGVVHFSDVKPRQDSADTLELQEAYKPGTTGAYSAPTEAAETEISEDADGLADQPEQAPEPQLTRAQQIRQDMERDRQRRKEEKAANDFLCDLHRKRLEEMEPARRVYYTNEAGESVRMDDGERVALIQESNLFVDRNCQ